VILVQRPARSRGHWTVECDVHGHVANQTALAYGVARVALHRDEAACSEVLLTVERAFGGFAITCGRCGYLDSRTRQDAALRLARSHAESAALDGSHVGKESL